MASVISKEGEGVLSQDITAAVPPRRVPVRIWNTIHSRRPGIVLVLVAVVIVSQVTYSNFLTGANISAILTQNAPEGIIAVGMTFVIITAGFDLSVGSSYAFAAVVYPTLSQSHWIWLAALGAIGAALLGGVINAVAIVKFRVSPFIATLGTMNVILGIAMLYSHAQPVTGSGAGFQWLGTGHVLGVPVPIWIFAIVFVVGGAVLRFTVYGRNIYGIGGNEQASHLAGVRVGLNRGVAYIMVAGLAGLAGVITASMLGSGEANIGTNTALSTITMVVIGGTALSGGEGAMWRTLVGVLIIGGLTNLFESLSVNSNWVDVATGGILIVAVAMEQLSGRDPFKAFRRAKV